MRKDDHELVVLNDRSIDSSIIKTTIRIIAPFTLTYGLFMTFNGADTPGGAFQGGIMVAATILMLAFGYGIDTVRRKIKDNSLTDLIVGGTLIFGLFGLLSLFLGGSFLDHTLLSYLGIASGLKWSMEAIEIGGIFLIIVGTFVGLFFVLASGFKPLRSEVDDHNL